MGNISSCYFSWRLSLMGPKKQQMALLVFHAYLLKYPRINSWDIYFDLYYLGVDRHIVMGIYLKQKGRDFLKNNI